MQNSKKHRKAIFLLKIFGAIVITLFFLRYFSIPKKFNNRKINKNEIEIHMISVGQSEAILVIQGENTMLIDTGGIFEGKNVVDYLYDNEISHLDYLVLTHFHQDHIGGAHKVISAIDIDEIIQMDASCFNTAQELFWYSDVGIAESISKTIYRRKTKITSPYNEDGTLRTFMLGDAKITILSQDTEADIVNNKSIVLRLDYGEFSTLFMSDAQGEVENHLLDDGAYLDADILKVGHHGSRTSTSKAFLKEVDPEIALISCGYENSNGHPHDSVMNKLNKRKIQVYRTDLMGSIVVRADERGNITVETEK